MRNTYGLVLGLMGILISGEALASAGRMGRTLLWTCEGNGVKSVTVTRTSGATVSHRAIVILTSGENKAFTLVDATQPGRVGAPQSFVEKTQPPTRPSFWLTIHVDGAPSRDGRTADLEATMDSRTLNQTVKCKR